MLEPETRETFVRALLQNRTSTPILPSYRINVKIFLQKPPPKGLGSVQSFVWGTPRAPFPAQGPRLSLLGPSLGEEGGHGERTKYLLAPPPAPEPPPSVRPGRSGSGSPVHAPPREGVCNPGARPLPLPSRARPAIRALIPAPGRACGGGGDSWGRGRPLVLGGPRRAAPGAPGTERNKRRASAAPPSRPAPPRRLGPETRVCASPTPPHAEPPERGQPPGGHQRRPTPSSGGRSSPAQSASPRDGETPQLPSRPIHTRSVLPPDSGGRGTPRRH
ncbi:basic proline-rich protein-like [Pipistrellus kuhlii]|uniref:basic proline-rich protein-like n=1 Tax=Pipistrellus kuhlii TaxID=59472 RepID=UPI00174F046B|nr:basic proline-rich protein-like [Pipistrellus kuhlii]